MEGGQLTWWGRLLTRRASSWSVVKAIPVLICHTSHVISGDPKQPTVAFTCVCLHPLPCFPGVEPVHGRGCFFLSQPCL